MEDQNVAEMAMLEVDGVGELTNSGFRTVVAAVALREDSESGAIVYAAVWNGERVDVVVQPESRMASSHELFAACSGPIVDGIDAPRLIELCSELRMD